MREACTLARDMLDLCCEMAQPGVTTDEIDAIVHSAIVEAGACPSPLNYHGFPKVRERSVILYILPTLKACTSPHPLRYADISFWRSSQGLP